MANYYQKEIETAPREQIRAWQDERLVSTVKRVYENVEYYRKKMDDAGVKPEDIKSVDDLHKLPFLTKDDLRDAYPYGRLLHMSASAIRCIRPSSSRARLIL